VARRAGLLRRVARGLLWGVLAAAAAAALLVLLLRWVDPPSSAFMIGSRLGALIDGDHSYQTHYEWVDLERISPQAALAVIAAEDQQFPFHAGFDFKSIREAVRHNASSRQVRGASTISQQVAKNLFLWSGRSYLRKGLEAGFTLLIEVLWPKERILEVYLNVAEFGRGIYGVQAAAQHFYHKDARRLNRADSALLAAVLPNPRRYRVEAPSRFVLTRRDWIARQMAELGGTSYLNYVEAETERQP
jgi:monofunctional biosynthetic peptidoglycan transglycosylase